MTKMGIGIIGCGNISTAYLTLAPLFKALEVRAVADINADAAKAQAEKFGVRAETVDGLLASDDIDMVVNLTIPAVHYAVTRQILEAGKHAYSEKPLVLTLDEATALRDLATTKGLRVGSAPDTFLGGAHQRARQAIDENAIGRIIGGTCHVMNHGMEHWHPNPDFFYQPGAGPVLDLGPYYITNLVQLIGSVKSVAAMTAATFAERTISNGPRNGETVPVDTPTNLHSLLEFENGAIVTLGASWDVWAHRHREMELYGETGSLYIPDPNFFGGEVNHIAPDGADTALEFADHPFGIENMQDGRGIGRANYRCAGLADMAAAIQEGREHRCNLDLAVHVVEVMTAILKAGETRAWVNMTTTCARPDALTPNEARALLA